ncbi:HEPN domain-containing protein [Candidatus Parcubacteria bacterium]|nr:HEPN domain-containing protein [Candidatus Parcubacteria bacterium]
MQKQLKEQMGYWKKSAQKNLDAAKVLFDNKHYDSCLFFGHLALEKIIKGLVIKQINKAAPLIHDLERLALLAKLELSEEQIKHLRTITDFNIAGRYSEIKYNFYKKCTKEYTEKNLKIIKELFLCIEKKYQKK